MRILERWKLVRRVYHRGERKNFYQIRGNTWEVVSEIAATIFRDELREGKALVSRSMQEINSTEAETSEDQAEIQFFKDRLSEAQEYMEACEHILSLFLERGKITPAVLKKVEIT
jgi:DNA-binding transcriptional regulator GbsR (MarR family)